MPSTVQSVNPFRPVRWILAILIALVVAYAVGYTRGLDDRTGTAPPAVTQTQP